MTRLSTSDLALLQEPEQYTDLYLSIFQPTIALQCQVNDGSITRGEREVTFDNATEGSWENVKIGSTLLVGSSVGARNVGKVRVKSITSSVITVAENSHINWENDLYLTVLNYFDVWPIFPRIIQNPSDAEQVIFYKDYDISYTNQNANLGVFFNIGPHKAAFIEPETNNAQLYYSASGTYPLGNSITSYGWTFEGGNPATSSDNTPGTVVYTGSGHYLTTLEVSGSGFNETAYRYVSIYDRPNAGTNIPIQKWELSELAGSRGEGGWRATIRVNEIIDIQEGSIVVLFADEWYGTTKKSLGGNAPNASQIKFVGYVMDNSIRYNYKESSVSFEVGSITQVMKEMEGFAIELQSKASPSTWYEMADVNGKKAAYHYWRWHSNIITLADIEWIGDDFLIQYYDSDRESLFDAVDNFLRTTYLGSIVSDRQGKMYLETDAYARPDATGTYAPLFTLSDTDWIETPEITEQRYTPLAYAEFGGIAYSGVVTGSYVPLQAEMPGTAPAYRGGVDRRQGLALSGQSQLNQLVGNFYAHENAQFPNIDIQFKGNYSNLDIAPQEVLQTDISASDTVRGVAINAPYIPTNLVMSHNPDNKALLVRGTLNVLTTGVEGSTIVIPEIIDGGGYGGPRIGGFRPLSIPLPSIPTQASVYGALKLETKGGVLKSLPQNVLVEVPLTRIVFSTEGLPAGTASGTWSGLGANIIPTVGASGTYGINYGFVTTYPGTYRITYNVNIENIGIGAGTATMESQIKSNTPYPGLIKDYTNRESFDIQEPVGFTMQSSTILYLSAGGYVTIQIINYSTHTGFVIDRAKASLEFLAYG